MTMQDTLFAFSTLHFPSLAGKGLGFGDEVGAGATVVVEGGAVVVSGAFVVVVLGVDVLGVDGGGVGGLNVVGGTVVVSF